MPKLSPINSCGTSASLCNFWELQINNEHQTQNNIWFKTQEDVSLSEGGLIEIATTTSDATVSGAGRESVTVDSFAETVTFTFNDGAVKQFNQSLIAVYFSDDEYKKEFLNCGMNVRKTICFPNGARIVVTYLGCTTTSAGIPATQVQGSDATFDLALQLPEPIVENIGFTPEYPGGIALPEITTELVFDTTANTAVATATVVSDTDNLIVPTSPTGQELMVTYYKNDVYAGMVYSGDTFTFDTGIVAGDVITTIWQFSNFLDSAGQRHYYTYKTETETLQAPPSTRTTKK